MALSDLVYGAYERRLARRLDPARLPHHVGAIVDGNRRWAKRGGTKFEAGYQAGADKISEFAVWCDDLGVEIVTLWLLSTDNLQRPDEEVASILDAVENLMRRLADEGRWSLAVIGNLDMHALPACLLYTSDAADDLLCVALGGRRTIQKKTHTPSNL